MNTSGRKYCFPIPYFNPDHSRAIYLASNQDWQLYEYASQKSRSILAGLSAGPNINKYFFDWGSNGLTFAIPEKDRISFAQNLSENDLTAPPVELIYLPANTINANALFDFWVSGKQLAGFDLSSSGSRPVLDCEISKTFVITDLPGKELKNYCLDRSMLADQQGGIWNTDISANNRFVAWTLRKLPGNSETLGIVILNTETGHISYLEDYEFQGFGEINPKH